MIFVYFRQDISIYSAVDSDSCLNWNEKMKAYGAIVSSHIGKETQTFFFITLEVHRAERKRAIKKMFSKFWSCLTKTIS